MNIVRLSYPWAEGSRPHADHSQIMAIGQFDGLHLGHTSVIEHGIRLARSLGIAASVMTFNPNPKEILGKGDYEGYLTPLSIKEEILRNMGVDTLYVAQFNHAFSTVTPEQFYYEMLRPLKVHTAVVGFDFHFGHKGAGTPELLRELGQESMQVDTVPAFQLEGTKVSSTAIRRALREGDAALAARLLGRPYQIRGTVIDGDKRGRTIGFPTANLDLSEKYVVPKSGVYAVRVMAEGAWRAGVMNIGYKPTFQTGETRPSFEAHIFDYQGDLYGQQLAAELIDYIRPEQKFGSIDELVTQIRLDAEEARRRLI
ncbi:MULTISPECIES: bifunctional riboflavin kinase/FAD synthetase [Paenibacillus]|uniref:bifunctional riboflavin kinase/FAD synthetase n=1 Tax=Paenibacillus TaxID=44249 RepID=UPI00036AE0F9|nr:MULTISPECIES: bifunctional riboflavin kinase/FAD synthetase [Paenibacillus]